MKLRFCVNQAECFRRGINAPKSIVVVDVDPANLPQAHRELIAKRLSGGIDVCLLQTMLDINNPTKIVALAPTFEALIQAVIEDETENYPQKK